MLSSSLSAKPSTRRLAVLSITALLLTCLTHSTLPLVSAAMVLRQVHVVSRQGSATTIMDGDENPPTEVLSAVGESQMFQLGAWIRTQFHQDSEDNNVVASNTDDDEIFGTSSSPSSSKQGILTDQYLPSRVRLESSSLETTLVSAQALARGLFPNNRIGVPVFTQAPRNDITIAAESQCFSYQNDLQELTKEADYSSDWNQMEGAYMLLLQHLAKMDFLAPYATGGIGDKKYIPLHQIGKVYDLIREIKLTCNEGFDSTNIDNCNQLSVGPDKADLLFDSEWDDLKTLAHYAEAQTKYGNPRAGQLLGGNLLREIVQRMLDDEMSLPNDTASKRLFVTSTDYPTLIALMAALQVVADDEILDEAFPGYGSAMVFELYQDDNTPFDHAVRVLYKKAGDAKASVLRLGEVCFEKDLCQMTRFTQLLDRIILGTSDWCQACGNDISDICLFYNRLQYQAQQSTTESHSKDCPDESHQNDVVAFIGGGIALGMILTGLSVFLIGCLRRLCQKRRNGRAKKRSSLAEINTKLNFDQKTSADTPATVMSVTPMSFFPSYWTSGLVAEDENSDLSCAEDDDPGKESDDEDANEEMSLVSQDDIQCSQLDNLVVVAKSPMRRPVRKGMHKRTFSVPTPTRLPAKVFSPEIV